MGRAAWPLLLIASLTVAVPLAAATGSLRIESQPGVEVTWEGTSLGRTDSGGVMVIEGIPPGEYVLDLGSPGYRSQRQRVVISEGTSTYNGYLERLEPKAVPKAPAALEPAPAEPDAPPSETSIEEGAGSLEPTAEPQAAPADPARPDGESLTAPSAGGLDSTKTPPVAEDSQPAGAADPEDESWGSGLGQVFLAFTIALAGGLAIFITGRRSSKVATRRSHKAADVLLEKTVSVSDDSRFIESLKERERALRDSTDAGDVIDVEVIEVHEIDGDA